MPARVGFVLLVGIFIGINPGVRRFIIRMMSYGCSDTNSDNANHGIYADKKKGHTNNHKCAVGTCGRLGQIGCCRAADNVS